jgi:ABC-type nitrate/sulfonate/bicarbonate transport system permease component
VFFTADQGGKVVGVYNSHPQNVFVIAAQMFSAFILLTVIGVIFYQLVAWVDHRVMKWRVGE